MQTISTPFSGFGDTPEGGSHFLHHFSPLLYLVSPLLLLTHSPIVLNADEDVQRAFLTGHYAGDGLKKGNGESIKTNSAVLAQGLCLMYFNQQQPASVYVEHRDGRTYYQLNLRSAARVGARGQHLSRSPTEVRRVAPASLASDEWVFDLETESGVFCAGVGRLVVHNSPRRGLEFVTRKVTHGVARIVEGLDDKIPLGNTDSQRDWGFAPDYVRAMWLMLQQEVPSDFVVASGETHSVRELCEVAFDRAGLKWEDHVVVDARFLRPAEVDLLVGDATKARGKIGWKTEVGFPELVSMMVDADIDGLRSQQG